MDFLEDDDSAIEDIDFDKKYSNYFKLTLI
jgi:hypothetical protein